MRGHCHVIADLIRNPEGRQGDMGETSQHQPPWSVIADLIRNPEGRQRGGNPPNNTPAPSKENPKKIHINSPEISYIILMLTTTE